MFLKSKNILALEILPGKVNIVEGVRSSRQIKVLNYLQLTNLPDSPEETGKLIAVALKEKGVAAKSVYLSLYDSQIEQTLLQTPVLSKKELQLVVKREVKKIRDKGNDKKPEEAKDRQEGKNGKTTREPEKKGPELYFDYQVLAEITQEKTKKKSLLLATAPQPLIDKYVKMLDAAELSPLVITASPLALINAQGLISPLLKDSSAETNNLAILHLLPDKGLLVILNQGIWRFFRELPLVYKPQTEESKANILDYQQLITEVNRSFLYFNQVERGKRVNGLIISADFELPDEMAYTCSSQLQVSVASFDPAEKLNLPGTDEFKNFSPQAKTLPVVLGLLVEGGNQLTLNFLPWQIRERKKHVAGKVVIGLVFTGYVVAIVAGYGALSWAQENYRQAVDSQKLNLEQMRPQQEEKKRLSQEQQGQEFRRTVLQKFERKSPLWRGLLVEFNQLLRPGLIFSSLEITEGEKETWQLKASGTIDAATSGEAQQTLKEYMENMKQAVFFSQPEVLEVKIVPYKPEAKGQTPDGNFNARLGFTLSCFVRY
ncbi:MAG: hypothetical protein HZA78_08495 [Candidatus Schekmanbacteria bacterium]|nr:hypothetical protein [Candidatus Schekmanbacteria bacterium]